MALSTTPTQTVSVSQSGATMVATTTIASAAAGATLVFGWGVLGTGQVVTPSCPNTVWTAVVQTTLAGIYEEIWVGKVSGGASGTTLTLTAASANYSTTNCRGWFQQWDGADGVGYLGASTSNAGSLTASTPSVTPTSAVKAVVIGLMRAGAAATFGAPNNSFTDPGVSGSSLNRNVWRYIASTSGSYTCSETLTASVAWISAAVVLYEPTAAAATIITTQPSNAVSGVANSPSPVAKATTDGVTVDTSFVGTCTATIASGSGSLSGTTAVTCVAGVATFSNLIITGSGAHTLTFTMTGYSAVTSSSITISAATATQALIFTQPSASVATGVAQSVVAKAYLADGTTVDTTYTGTATLTLLTPTGFASGSVAGTLTGSCVAGAFTFSPTPTGDGPGYGYHVAMAGLTAADTTTFTVIGTVVAANQAFVTAMGGDAALFNVHDPRIFANGSLASISDVIGPIGGRAAGITCTGSGVTVASGKIVLTAASSPDLESAADARLAMLDSFATPRAIWDLVIAEATATGPLVGIAKDPTSTVAYPSMYVQPAGTTWQVAIASDGSTPTPTNPPIPNTAGAFTNDTGVAFAGGTIRAMAVGKMAYQTASLDQGNNINHPWGFLPFMAGKQPRFIHRVKPATSGNNKLAYGRFGSSYGTGKVHYRAQYTGDWTLTQSLAFIAFARAQFGATIDIVAVPSFAIAGNSLVNSTTQQSGGDMQSPVYGSGTTSFPSYMANYGGGSHVSLLAAGLDVAEVHSYAYGRSGGDLQFVIDTFSVELALLADGTRSGKVLIGYFDCGNSLAGGGMDQTSFLAGCVTLKGQCDALASTSGLTVNLLHILDSDRTGYYNTSYPTIPSGYSADGTDRVNIGIAMLASPLTYGAAVFDAASIASQAIGTFAAPKCYSATYYNITANGAFGGGDATHQAPAGYSALGIGVKGMLDARWDLLFTTTAVVMRRSAMAFTGRIGSRSAA